MWRKELEKKSREVTAIFIIIVVGAILGAFVGGMVVENANVIGNVFTKVGFCIAMSCTGSIVAIIISYYVTSAIMEVQSAIKEKKSSN